METMVLRIIHSEVERQCKFALIAVRDLKQALHIPGGDRLWHSVQAFLVAAGNISKLLWPPRRRRPLIPERASELRTSLSVGEHSPLKRRTFRNHFEHFDERLEQWATSPQRGMLINSNVGSPRTIGDSEPGHYPRNFDTTNSAVSYCGDVYYLQPVVDAIRDFLGAVENVAQ